VLRFDDGFITVNAFSRENIHDSWPPMHFCSSFSIWMRIRIFNCALPSSDVTRAQGVMFHLRRSVAVSKVNITLVHAMKASEDGAVEV